MRMKGLMRKSRLQRVLSTKTAGHDGSPAGVPERQEKRQFLLEAAVQFTTGVQSQARHLFLFNDLLLLAKPRSGGNFKLKEKVRVSEMWLARCVDEVSEVTRSYDTSFVLGWPTTNVVVTFGTQAARDLWWSKLSEVVSSERDKEPTSTNIQVVYYDQTTNIEYVKTFSVTARETARCCVRLALAQLEMRGHDPSQFQLWARIGRDEAPYPLIGHERPFSIKLSALRQALSTEEGFDLDHCNNIHGTDPLTRCQFVLRRKSSDPVPCESKKGKTPRKSPMRIRGVFRRSSKDCPDSAESTSPGQLFGQPLSRVCAPDASPPPTVLAMLQQVFAKGPFTQGIFRKSANARLVREARAQLDSGSDVGMLPVLVTAALLKDFLRSLPDPLLTSALYSEWLIAADPNFSEQQRLTRLSSLIERLPSCNQVLLAHLLCVLHHIACHSSLNLMTPTNLGVCVGPSVLWGPSLSPATSRAVPTVLELLIARCELLLGPGVTRLLGDPPDPLRQDSGAEESDSLHSGGLRRDDSSLDSLEREELLLGPSPPPRKDKMSLSRDSGLTMSDCQLYTPDEEESSSTSSGLSGDAKNAPRPPAQHPPHNKLSSTFSHPSSIEYVRVYGGWEERIECCRKGKDDSVYGKARHSTPKNSNFQRQDWFRQRSNLKRLNSGSKQSQNSSSCSSSSSSSSGSGGNSNVDVYGHNKNELRRSASEESLLNKYNSVVKRPALHTKGRAPAPPQETSKSRHLVMFNNLSRSKSAHHICSQESDMMSPIIKPLPRTPTVTCEDWARSQSTPHIAEAAALALDDMERSYDSSTLSDDDSTPHVSRSNSRGKDCPAANSTPALWDSNVYEVTCRTSDLVRAAPVMTTDSDQEVPPLPPKNRRSPTDGGSVKLRHLPPVHVKLESGGSPSISMRKSLGRPNSCHVTESQVESMYSSPLRSVLETYSTPDKEMTPKRKTIGRPSSCHISESQIESMYSSPIEKKPLRPVIENHQESLYSTPTKEKDSTPERRGRLKRRGLGASQRSKSLPPAEKQPDDEEQEQSCISEEISWSVSKLRTLFGETKPPPYRPPPKVLAIPSHRAPITSFHLGNSQSHLQLARLLDHRRDLTRVDSTESTSEEESYV